MAFDYGGYVQRKREARTQRIEGQQALNDPARATPTVTSGRGVSGNPVRVAGVNMDGTSQSRYNQGRLAAAMNARNTLENRALSLQNTADAQHLRASAPGSDGTTVTQRGQVLGDLVRNVTPADRNPNYGTPQYVLGAGGNVGGVNQTRFGESFVQTGQAAEGANLRDVLSAEQQHMGRGSGVAVTESGRVIRVDPDYEYNIQRDIDNPELRSMVPAIAQANAGAHQSAEQKARLAQVLELGKSGIDLPEGADLNNITPDTLHKMNVQAGKGQASQAYQKNYMSLAKIMSGLKVPTEDGLGERNLTPEEIHGHIQGAIGPAPGSEQKGNAVDDAIAGAIADQGGAPAAAQGAPSAAAQAVADIRSQAAPSDPDKVPEGIFVPGGNEDSYQHDAWGDGNTGQILSNRLKKAVSGAADWKPGGNLGAIFAPPAQAGPTAQEMRAAKNKRLSAVMDSYRQSPQGMGSVYG